VSYVKRGNPYAVLDVPAFQREIWPAVIAEIQAATG
jgi:hypothetical protein